MTLALPEYLQTKKSPAIRFRDMWLDAPIQSGVVAAGDWLVTQRAAGATMSVDIAQGAGFIKGTTSSRQGMYHAYNDATVNLPIANNTSGQPRLDQIVCHIYDSIDGGDAQDNVFFEVVPGVGTAGATLDTRNGFGALPNTSVRIADVLVANGAASITNAVIRDRRPWARGFQFSKRGDNAGNFTIATTVLTSLGAGQFDGRFEKGENSYVEFYFEFDVAHNTGGGVVSAQLDVVSRAGASQATKFVRVLPATSFLSGILHMRSDASNPGFTIPGGDTYTWNVKWSASTGTGTMTNSDARLNPVIIVREVPVPPLLANNFTP